MSFRALARLRRSLLLASLCLFGCDSGSEDGAEAPGSGGIDEPGGGAAAPWCEMPTMELLGEAPESGGPDPCFVPYATGSIPGAAPALTRAHMIEENVIELTFTEPIGPVGDVDPRAFRLGIEMSDVNSVPAWRGLAKRAMVGDGQFLELEHVCGEPNKLRLRSSKSLVDACDCLEFDCGAYSYVEYAGYGGDVVPLLHFFPPGELGLTPLQDMDGEPLASVGGWWVGHSGYAGGDTYFAVDGTRPPYDEGMFLCNDLPIPVTCTSTSARAHPIGGQHVEEGVFELTFSEPITTTREPDPDEFRLVRTDSNYNGYDFLAFRGVDAIDGVELADPTHLRFSFASLDWPECSTEDETFLTVVHQASLDDPLLVAESDGRAVFSWGGRLAAGEGEFQIGTGGGAPHARLVPLLDDDCIE